MSFILFILGLAPIIWLAFALLKMKWPTFKAAIGSFLISVILAVLVWHLPVIDTATAALEGTLMAIWPIIIVIIAAVFTYRLSLKNRWHGCYQIYDTSFSTDKRVLVY
mgnify:CR=1 FL=1